MVDGKSGNYYGPEVRLEEVASSIGTWCRMRAHDGVLGNRPDGHHSSRAFFGLHPCRVPQPFRSTEGVRIFLRLPGEQSFPAEVWYNCYTVVRFHFDARKSARLRRNPRRGIGFEEAQEVFYHPYYADQRSDLPPQHRAIGWVSDRLYTVIFEMREDAEGEFCHLVTLWKATREEQRLYEEHDS